MDSSDVVDDAAIQQHLGAAIKDRRQKAGLSQVALAERAGLHRTYINQLENGHKAATVVALVHVARALNVSPATLMRELS